METIIGVMGRRSWKLLEGQWKRKWKQQGLYRDYMGVFMGSIGIMEKKMETIIIYWCYIGIM